MKIGVYLYGYIPREGGGYTFEREILLSLCAVAHDYPHDLVLIFDKLPANEINAMLQEKRIKSVWLGPPRSAPRYIRLASKILRKIHLPFRLETPPALQTIVEKEKLHLVWCAVDIFHPLDVPYIATVFDIQHRNQPWFPEVSQNGIWHLREDYYCDYLRRAAYIITPNIIGRDELSLFYGIPPERFRLLPHPSPQITNVSEEKVKAVLDMYHLEKGYFFYPAQFWPHKNHANLLMALKIMLARYGHTRQLVLTGADKGNLDYIRTLTQSLGLAGQVHFLDFVPQTHLVALYQGAFALTYLSLFGPENLPPLEAFQCDCPVILTDYNGGKQQFQDAVLYVNGLDPEAIADAFQKLETNPDIRQTLIMNGRKRSRAYTGENYIRDVYSIFNEFDAVRRTWGNSYALIDN